MPDQIDFGGLAQKAKTTHGSAWVSGHRSTRIAAESVPPRGSEWVLNIADFQLPIAHWPVPNH